MSSVECEFLKDQLVERKMFCMTEVDRSWAITASRKRKEKESLKRQQEKAELEQQDFDRKVEIPEEDGDCEEPADINEVEDGDYNPDLGERRGEEKI